MAGVAGRSGRRSKGERHTFNTRVPIQDAREVIAGADAAKTYYGEYLAALVHIGLQHLDELPEKFQPKPAEEVLPEAS